MAPEELLSPDIWVVPPWLVDHVTYVVDEKRLDLHVNFPADCRFAFTVCREGCPVHDTREHTWRHMDFFQHEAYLHARV
ncbi:MAG: ISL3 family transposase, partial [Acidithiobacillus sp.]